MKKIESVSGVINDCIQHELMQVPTHMTQQERWLLAELASTLPPHATALEIGSYCGASTCFLAIGVASVAGHVYAVDTWQNDGMSEGSRDTYAEFLKNIRPLEKCITPLRGKSTDVATQFDQSLDLLFIDGDHSYEGVRADIEHWLPKLKNNGILIFHDYSWSNDIQRAVQELVVPKQSDIGRCLDSIYWTRVHSQNYHFDLCVVIPTQGRWETLQQTLESLYQQKTVKQFEVIVINDSGTTFPLSLPDDSKLKLRVENSVACGLHNGRNLGALLAQSKIIAYLDDDVFCAESWVDSIVQAFEDPLVVGVGGKVLPAWENENTKQKGEAWPATYFSLLDYGDAGRAMAKGETPHGCNMAFLKRVILEHQGFPPDAFNSGHMEWWRGDGETGFTKHLMSLGLKVQYEPKAWVYHKIPSKRLKDQALIKRTFREAVTVHYNECRQQTPRRRHALIKSLKFFKSFVVKMLNHAFKPNEKTWILSFQDLASSLWLFRWSLDSKLRAWVKQKSYWSIDLKTTNHLLQKVSESKSD